MDKNTLTGFALILAIIIGFSILNRPSKQQREAAYEQKRYADSIAMIETARQVAEKQLASSDSANNQPETSAVNAGNNAADSLKYGAFAALTQGDTSYATLENDLLKLTFSSKGGRIVSANLKKFVTGDSSALILFDESTSDFNFSFFSTDSRLINTADMNFTLIPGNDSLSLIYRLTLPDNTWMDFIYQMQENDYRVSFKLKGNNLASVMLSNTRNLDFSWKLNMRQQEIGRKFEERYSGMNYKFLLDDVEKLPETKESTKNVPEDIKWVAFKDQFFACIAIADNSFSSNQLYSKPDQDKTSYIKEYALKTSVAFDPEKDETTGMQLYFGPIKYALLKSFDKGLPADQKLRLSKIVPLGGKMIRWVNTGIILPMFNFFGKFISNYGLIILIMTFIIKTALFPLTYKSFMSSAKMKVLQPQITEINEKFKGSDKASERSAATMELYRKAGVNPMGGCLPMLLQMPFLFAMYSFFPASIELRQESFLWAHDLSSFDAIISWSGNIPYLSKFLGNHISLFCVLMTVTNIVYTHLNMKTQPSNNQMPGMKTMMYLMPVMLFFMFNQYSSGLSFYFFVSTLISILQTYAIRASVNDEKLLLQLNENKKKPRKKSGFAARLEQMQKQQQQALKNQQQQKKLKK